ncbi:MAG: hypothetical protein R3F59_08190 [Myxococcota bacterium]
MPFSLALLAACTPPTTTTSGGHTPDTDVAVTDTPTGDTSAKGTGDTGGDTTTTTIAAVCLEPPPAGPLPFVRSSALRTEEDFDFDRDGFLDSQGGVGGQDLVGMTRQGQSHVVAPNIGVDAAGIRSLPSGDLVVAQPDTNALRLVTYGSGGSRLILDVTNPNGLETTSDDLVFSSEYRQGGRVRLVDPYTGQASIIATMDWPNNMALSPDETVLYVAASPSAWGGTGVIARIEKDAEGGWGDPEPFFSHDTAIGGITTDICGNVYAVEFTGGVVFRLPADGSAPEVLADLGRSGTYSSMRFGHGLDGWERTELFVTNRSDMFVMDVGIPGRHVLAVDE